MSVDSLCAENEAWSRLDGDRACLLLHGFTGTPREMRGLASFLTAQGFSVAVPRLAGHGTSAADLRKSRYPDWLESAEAGWTELKQHTDRISVIGLSMGGVLALNLASRLSCDKVVALATPARLPGNPVLTALLRAAPLLDLFIQSVPAKEDIWFNPENAQGHQCYDRMPLLALCELQQLIEATVARLEHIKAPVLLCYSEDDPVIPLSHAQLLRKRLSGTSAALTLLKGTGHALTMDAKRDEVFAAIATFLGTKGPTL